MQLQQDSLDEGYGQIHALKWNEWHEMAQDLSDSQCNTWNFCKMTCEFMKNIGDEH